MQPGRSNEETKIDEEKKTDEERAQKYQKILAEMDRRDDMEELAIEEILDMKEGISRKPIPAITYPLKGEQYYIDP